MLSKVFDIISKIVHKHKGIKYSGRLTLTLIFNKGGIRDARLVEHTEKEYDLKSQS